MGSNIQLTLTAAEITVTGVQLWNFDSSVATFFPNNTISQIDLRVSLSDGKRYFVDMVEYPYEYEETRKEHLPETNPGYYRFAVDSYYDSDTGETVSISTKWTDWYYLSNSIYYVNGVRSGD